MKVQTEYIIFCLFLRWNASHQFQFEVKSILNPRRPPHHTVDESTYNIAERTNEKKMFYFYCTCIKPKPRYPATESAAAAAAVAAQRGSRLFHLSLLFICLLGIWLRILHFYYCVWCVYVRVFVWRMLHEYSVYLLCLRRATLPA